MLAAALEAFDAGLCPIQPMTDGSKRPLPVRNHGKLDATTGRRRAGWEAYQSERPSRQTVEAWFAASPGLGIVTGAVSGRLEMLEFEGRAVREGLLERLVGLLDAADRATLERIVNGYSETTPSDGLHLFMRITDGPAAPSTKLAMRPSTAAELAANPRAPLQTLVETRGESGFVVVAPSNGTTHPTGRPWVRTRGGFATIAEVTVAERNRLYAACRTLDQTRRTATGIVEIEPAGLAPEHHPYADGPVGSSWFDAVVEHLAATDTLAAALVRYGWVDLERNDPQGCPEFERPGQTDAGRTGGLINKSDRLVVFSTSTPFATTLERGTHGGPTYDLLDVYAAYEHRGDRTAAARAIADKTGIYDAWLAQRPVLGALQQGGEQGAVAPPAGVDVAAGEIVRFRRYSVAELLAERREFEWLAVGMLVDGTYGVDAGELKSLKSYLGLARAVGLAAGVPVLGRWRVPEQRRVLMFVAEGGRTPFARRLERVCEAYGIAAGDLDGWLEVIDDVAPLNSAELRGALACHLRDFAPAMVHLDPLYPFQPSTVSSSQYAEVGEMLTAAQRICADHGATFWLTAHMNQTGAGFDLKRISGAGHGEWADSWSLVRHRHPPDVNAGRFRLGLELGSRQWGGSTWDVDISIGRFDADLGIHDGAISWNVRPTIDAGDAGEEEVDPLTDVKLEIMRVGRKARRPLTRAGWLARVERRNVTKRAAFDELVDEGQIVADGGTPNEPTYVVARGK